MYSISDCWNLYKSDNNVRQAINKSSEGKRDRSSVALVYYDQDNQVPVIQDYATHFYNDKHNELDIYDGVQRKVRHIVIPTYREQVVHHMLIQATLPIFTRGMYEHSYASIPGRGGYYGKKTIEKWLKHGRQKNFKYCLKMDIHHFFDSIDHDVLADMLKKHIKDKKILSVYLEVIQATERGLPLGFYTSQWLANWYLQGLDHFIKEQLGALYYIRYMDDMVIFGPNKKKLHWMREQISKYIGVKLHLTLKDNWQVFRFSVISKDGKDLYRPLDFMGYKFYRNRTTVRKSILLKAKRKALKIKKKGITEFSARQMLSYKGWFEATNTHEFYEAYIKPCVNFWELSDYISKIEKGEQNGTQIRTGNGVSERQTACT